MTVEKTNTINCLEPGQVYKYLGVDESNGIQHSMMRERLRREYFRRVKVVLQTELYGQNKILAICHVSTHIYGVWEGLEIQGRS